MLWKFKYRLKVKANNFYDLTNAGFVVSQKDCVEGEYWLLTNSPGYLRTSVDDAKLEVIGDVEVVPQ